MIFYVSVYNSIWNNFKVISIPDKDVVGVVVSLGDRYKYVYVIANNSDEADDIGHELINKEIKNASL